MWTRALIIWFAILAVAFANGALRVVVLAPRVGTMAGHVASTVLLSGAVLVITIAAAPWIGIASTSAAWRIGLLWVAMTLAFEWLAGHYLFGTPWRQLAADYDLTAGRIWPLVLVITALAPWLATLRR